jgi:chemotaxis protein CheC
VVTGDAVLLLEYDRAAELASIMTEGQVASSGQIDHSAREVLTEVGNIVLGSCLSAFGNLLKVSVTFAVPRMHVESLDGLLRSLHVESDEVQYAMVATTRFKLSGTEVGGYLIIVIGLSSLQLISSVMEAEAT